ncbi:C40 family peptidase [Paramicrobacterium agarici]|uniref:Cell wall-associated NlpC family hydrolase n=1 Tax=Paramicrobacterium agarici TaxID=630514 RepID=A0A2A9DXZ4_9MICO|nr:C40 family peptidase [Microbacterium agarici]PFG30810.1 cell wall-associated NlpC family hydrolase [Microbacterium agarici]
MALSTPTEPESTSSASDAPLTRRQRRAAEAKASTELAHVRSTPRLATTRAARSASTRPATRTAPASAERMERTSRWKRWRSTLVMMIVVPGLCAAFALPGSFAAPSQAAALYAETDRTAGAQELSVSTEASIATVARDTYSATTQGELDAAAAEKAAAEAAKRARAAAENSTPSGTAAPAAPPTTPYSLSAVFNTAKQYIGTPYVYGGATPAGFDCSGFIMYVFGQYGISLPHGVSGQAAAGTRIPTSQAQPGDLVIMNGHDGFYAGNGMILDAPKPGGHVSIRPIWTSNYYIVRI